MQGVSCTSQRRVGHGFLAKHAEKAAGRSQSCNLAEAMQCGTLRSRRGKAVKLLKVCHFFRKIRNAHESAHRQIWAPGEFTQTSAIWEREVPAASNLRLRLAQICSEVQRFGGVLFAQWA